MANSEPKAATLRDVARRAGVSHVTVSRVLSGNLNVTPATSKTVMRAVRALKYQPNVAARTLVLRRGGNFPILLQAVVCHARHSLQTQLPGAFQMQVLQGVCDAVHTDGHTDFSMSYWRGDEDQERQLARLQRASGVLLMGNSDRELVVRMKNSGIKLVLADQDHEGIEIDAVVSDNLKGSRAAVRYLLDRGHRHIGWMGGPAYNNVYRQREEGVRLELAKARVPLAPRDCHNASEDDVLFYERAMLEWVRADHLPTALVLCSPLAMPGVLHVMREHNLRCPDDISLISLDLDANNAACRPRPTALATYPQTIGRQAMERLIKIVRSNTELPPLKTIVPMHLIEGESVATLSRASKKK
ncbi:MAG: LacI family DNA-binding transcriptional regulator [bacterium]